MAAYVVGVAGGTGSGKTTVAEHIVSALPPEHVCIIQHDNYYRDRADLTYEQRCQLNFDHPDSLESELLVEHLIRLRAGEPIEAPVYDFKTHRRSEQTHTIEPRPVIVVEGILVFSDERLRELFDLKLFVDTPADIRVFRRIR